ncbi:transcription initiation factor IIB family protein [Halostella litorea]|uniref:hypothetical protein n=1 Tax=Halostella litorea TaxID=2528831 RepID=UPI00109208E1|nr:hypothetical protein [Halostella litorea]
MTATAPTDFEVPSAERPRNGTTLRGEYAVSRVCDALSLPAEAREDANRLLHGAFVADACPERDPETLGAAATYAAIRLAELPRTKGEVVEASDLPHHLVNRAYDDLVRAFGLCLSATGPKRFVGRVVDACDLPAPVEGRARDRLDALDLHESDDPLGLAAAAVVVASDAAPATVADGLPVSALAVRSWYVPRFE